MLDFKRSRDQRLPGSSLPKTLGTMLTSDMQVRELSQLYCAAFHYRDDCFTSDQYIVLHLLCILSQDVMIKFSN